MTEAKKHILAACRTHKTLQQELPEFEDNTAFAAHLAEQLRRLPYDSRINAMVEILAILNRFVRVQGSEAQ